MITIIDYGLGNILAFASTYRRLGVSVKVAKTVSDLKGAKKLILPGVGAFDLAMSLFQKSGMREYVDDLVLSQEIPVIGICVGMQMMASKSEEGKLQGLGWIPGTVRKFNLDSLPKGTLLPHMGWNDVLPDRSTVLFNGLESEARFYFLHSYYFDPDDVDHGLARSDYGLSFFSAVKNKNIYGVQFHPEKSHHFGSRLLQNFSEI